MKRLLFITIIGLLPIICKSQLAKDGTDSVKESQIYIGTDPTAPFFKGFSLVVRKSSTFHKNLNIGVGIYRVELPDFYIEAEESNIGKGWNADNLGVDLFADYFFFDSNKGLSLGLVLSFYNFNISRLSMENSYQSIVETLRIGYLWRPIKKANAIYIYPWVGISTDQKVSGNNIIAGETFTLSKWSFVPSIQVGISF